MKKQITLVATLVASASAITSGNTAACCEKLRAVYPQQVVFSGEPSFGAWNERWADTAELRPSCIFRPATSQDVSFAIRTLGDDGYGHCPFSIKSGGHTPWAGANNVDGGVALDLALMNQTTLAKDGSLVSLGGGGSWSNVYRELDGTGVVVPGGRCPGTGVGGVTLGGGYSWFIGQVGFSADNVLNYEIVLASGDVVDANATSNPDLFRALKGGGNNFGVVTRFDVAATPHSQRVHGGLVIVPTASTDEVLARLQEFTDDGRGGVHASAGLTVEFFVNATTGEGQVLLWLIDSDADGDHAALRPFLDMEPKLHSQVQTASIVDYPSAVPAVSRVLMADATIVNDLVAIRGVHGLTMDVMRTVAHVPDLTWDLQFEPLPRHVLAASNAKGGNVMGLGDAEEDLLVAFIMPLWQDAQYDGEVHAAAEVWYKEVKEYTARIGKAHQWEFPNYAAWFQDPMASYGPENLEFLRGVSRKYDPGRLFQTAVKGGYKLGDF